MPRPAPGTEDNMYKTTQFPTLKNLNIISNIIWQVRSYSIIWEGRIETLRITWGIADDYLKDMTDIMTSRQGNKEEKGHSPEGHYGHEPGQQEEGFKWGKGSELLGDMERKHF